MLFEEKEVNKFYEKAWKWFGYGMLGNYGIIVLMWPFTFIFDNWFQVAYMYAWGWPGWMGGVVVDIAVFALLVKALKRHDENQINSKKEIGAVLGVIIAVEALMGFLANWFMWDSVLYMLPRTCKAWFELKGKSYSSGVVYDM